MDLERNCTCRTKAVGVLNWKDKGIKLAFTEVSWRHTTDLSWKNGGEIARIWTLFPNVISEIWNHVQKYEIMSRPWPAAGAAKYLVDWSRTSTDEWMKSGWHTVVMVWWAARTGRRVELPGFKSGFSCSRCHAVVPGMLTCVHINMSYVKWRLLL